MGYQVVGVLGVPKIIGILVNYYLGSIVCRQRATCRFRAGSLVCRWKLEMGDGRKAPKRDHLFEGYCRVPLLDPVCARDG